MIRNSATLLLSTIVQRIFGPSKTKDGEENISKKNSMTSREFFNKYPSLFHLFYQQLQQTTRWVFCEIRSKRSIVVYTGRNLHPLPLITDYDRYSREIEFYGWNFIKEY
jgi:hypothetical protein